MRAGLLLLPGLWQSCGRVVAELLQSCGSGRDPVDVGAVVAAEPNRTEGAAEPNRTEGVVAPAVGDGVGVALGVLEDLVEHVEAVLVAVLT